MRPSKSEEQKANQEGVLSRRPRRKRKSNFLPTGPFMTCCQQHSLLKTHEKEAHRTIKYEKAVSASLLPPFQIPSSRWQSKWSPRFVISSPTHPYASSLGITGRKTAPICPFPSCLRKDLPLCQYLNGSHK